MTKNLISMLDVKDNINEIIKHGISLKNKAKNGGKIELLNGKTLGMIFEKSSTRTRASFEAGMTKLGGHAIFLSNTDIQLGRGETIEDTAIVLSRYVDIIMYRSKSHKDMKELADNATVPVINGLDNKEHPCQVITDLMTIKENKGSLKGLNFVYIGDGDNNMSHSYLLGCAMVGMNVKIVSPKKYWPDKYFIDEAKKFNVKIQITDNIEVSAKNADVIATDTWISMGDESEKEIRIKDFKGYTIDNKIMNQAKNDAIFLHCLPAYYGYEVTKEVAHGPNSVIFDEAENRMWAQMAIILNLLK
ncbi:ornithine carbamoyltransferase, partial [Thermoplasmatota archaeon]